MLLEAFLEEPRHAMQHEHQRRRVRFHRLLNSVARYNEHASIFSAKRPGDAVLSRINRERPRGKSEGTTAQVINLLARR
jgi:hypothetical protein